ncbi:hypothetical protein AWN76_014480 [Rhodothermaceae bacterium RA]|nr:hypothetical protein AWN76_014480 [Rhodothermaceae bacterium RA]
MRISPVASWLFGLVALLALVPAASAQTGRIQGRVVDAVTREPLPGVNVVIVGTQQGAATDLEGAFVIDDVAPGVYRVRASFLGFEPQTKTDIVVQPSRPTYVEFALREAAVKLGDVVVETYVFGGEAEAPTSVQVLGVEEVRRTPGGQNDISRTLLSLPGVIGGVDNRNDLIVRGGGPSENAYFLDGVPIPQINHFATQGATGGALGLLNVDFIRETEFYTGAFPARYGGALSSVLRVDNRPGSPDRVAGDFTLGAAEAALTLDGPFGRSGNWLLSARRSYLQFLFQALGLAIRPAYWDFQTRLEYTLDPKNRLLFVGLGAIDDFEIADLEDPDFEQQEQAQRVLDNDQWTYTNGLVWRHLLAGGFVQAVLSRSMTDFAFADVGADGEAVLRNDAQEAENHLRIDADLRLGRGLTLGVGGGAMRAHVSTRFFEKARPGTPFTEDLRFENALTLTTGFAYGQLTIRTLAGRLTVTPGLRLEATSFLDDKLYVSPRLSASVRLAPRWSVNAATGVFYQAPAYVSLVVQDAQGRYVNRSLPYLRADHYVGGLAWQARPSLRVTLEGFFKDYRDYPVSASDPRISLANLGGDFGYVGAEPLRGIGEGRSYGAELFVQQKLVERVYGLASYTLAWSEFAGADGVLRPSSWDVRHTVSLTGGIRFNAKWELGVKWRYLSGRPFTPFDPVASAEEYALTGRGVPDYDRLNAARSPAYHRLDVRVDRRFAFRGWNAVVYLDVQNLYNRTNLFGYAYTEDPAYPDRRRPIENVGLLPNFGFSIEW